MMGVRGEGKGGVSQALLLEGRLAEHTAQVLADCRRGHRGKPSNLAPLAQRTAVSQHTPAGVLAWAHHTQQVLTWAQLPLKINTDRQITGRQSVRKKIIQNSVRKAVNKYPIIRQTERGRMYRPS
jgi:hypothetical protein